MSLSLLKAVLQNIKDNSVVAGFPAIDMLLEKT